MSFAGYAYGLPTDWPVSIGLVKSFLALAPDLIADGLKDNKAAGWRFWLMFI